MTDWSCTAADDCGDWLPMRRIGDVAHPAVGGVEGHHAQGIQHQIHGAVPAVGKRQHCGAVGYGTHARLRAGVAEAVPRSLLVVVSMGGAVHGRRGRAPKTPTLLDVLWVRGRLKLQNHERSLPRVLDSNLRAQRHRRAYRWGGIMSKRNLVIEEGSVEALARLQKQDDLRAAIETGRECCPTTIFTEPCTNRPVSNYMRPDLMRGYRAC